MADVNKFEVLLDWIKQGRVSATIVTDSVVIDTVDKTFKVGTAGTASRATLAADLKVPDVGSASIDNGPKTRAEWLAHHRRLRASETKDRFHDAFMIRFKCLSQDDLDFAWNECEQLRTYGQHKLHLIVGEENAEMSFVLVYSKELLSFTKYVWEQYKDYSARPHNLLTLHDRIYPPKN
jgi:hypothetical protein